MLTFEFTLEEANLILKHLCKGAFEEVHELVGKIRTEGSRQITPTAPPPPPTTESKSD